MRSILYTSIAIFSAIGLIVIGSNYDTSNRRNDSNRTYIAPGEITKYFTFGYQESMSDSLWIRVVQDLDYCERMTRDKDGVPTGVDCGQGWVFQMLDSITTLTPRFQAPYAAGAVALSVLVNDKQGAKIIFDRGVKAYPNDWPIAYRAAYHYIFELNDSINGSELLVRAGKNGAPSWVFSLAGRLYTENGKTEAAVRMLEEMIPQYSDPKFVKKLEERLAQARKQLETSRNQN